MKNGNNQDLCPEEIEIIRKIEEKRLQAIARSKRIAENKFAMGGGYFEDVHMQDAKSDFGEQIPSFPVI
jgi:hypothetical protein